MNCTRSHHLLSAERDHALGAGERADLEQHLAGCAECRQFRTRLDKAVAGWRADVAARPAPDAERAWQDIRREIRAGAAGDSVTGLPRGAFQSRARPQWRSGRWSLSVGALGAAAVIALSVWGLRRPGPDVFAPVALNEGSSVEYVEVPENAASMVFVDDESGWVVVWSTPQE